MESCNASASGLNDKVIVRLWRQSFFTLLVAIHRSEYTIKAYSTEIKSRYVEKTKINPDGIEYDRKQVANNFWAIINEIEKQTGLRRMVFAALKPADDIPIPQASGMEMPDIVRAIEGIRQVADDFETAHTKEDDLRQAFIEHIAKRKDPIGEKAKMILTTSEIDFDRVCA